MAREKAGAETINYEEVDSVVEVLNELTGGRGTDACIDAVGMEAHTHHAVVHAYDRARQAMGMETDRPIGVREAIMACRNGGEGWGIGGYGGVVREWPGGGAVERG